MGLTIQNRVRTGRSAVMSFIALLLLVAMPASAGAADDELRRADLGAVVTANFGRGIGSGSWTLVEIAFSPKVPIAGRVEISSSGMSNAVGARDVEVAAGATKLFHLLLPPAEDLQARFVTSDGTAIALARPNTGGMHDVVVGAVGAAPTLPAPLNVAGLDRPVRGVALDRAVLDLGARGLDSLDALIVSAADLAAMDATQQHSLAVAAANGLDLLVPVRAGDGALPLPWSPITSATSNGTTPVALQPAPMAWTVTTVDLDASATGDNDGDALVAVTNAGRGRVVALAHGPGEPGPLTDGEVWADLLQPRADTGSALGSFDEGDLGNRLFGGSSSLPGMAGAMVFLIVYLVLVGPVNAFAVRRLGRRELTWVTVPAITVVFTAVAALTAAGGGSASTPVARAAWWLDGVGQEVTALNLQAPSRGTHTIVFPGARDTMPGTLWSQVSGSNTFDGTDTTYRAHLEALQTTTAVAFGRPDAAAPLEVTATYRDGDLHVDVTNRAEVDLEAVTVRAATATKDLGTLAAGESVSAVIDDLEATLPRAPGDRGMRMLGDRPRAAGDELPGPEVAERLLSWNVLDRSPGVVWVTATSTADLGLARPRVSGSIDDRGSFVAVGATPAREGATVLPHEVRRDVVRNGLHTPWRQQPLTINGEGEVVLRFRLPDATATGALVSTLNEGGAVRAMDMGFDPWGNGCFSVTRIEADGTESDSEELCGADIACPMGANECGGDDRRMEACFPDGACQIAERVGDNDREAPQEGFEIFDRQARSWVPAGEVFDDDGRADPQQVVSPFGEVLIRARNVDFLPYGQRGLGMEGPA